MGKYNRQQLEQIAKGVLKNSSKPHVYALSNGTILNDRQYDALDEATKKDAIKFENPKFAVEEAPAKAEKAPAKKETEKAPAKGGKGKGAAKAEPAPEEEKEEDA